MKKLIKITRRDLKNIIYECIYQIKEQLITEYADRIDRYKANCGAVSHRIMEHLLKICIFETLSPNTVPHWKDEIRSWCMNLCIGKLKVKHDKSDYFKEYVVDTYLGENNEEYDEIVPELIKGIIINYSQHEGKQKLVATENPIDIAARNKDRIINFYSTVLEASKGKGNADLVNQAVSNF